MRAHAFEIAEPGKHRVSYSRGDQSRFLTNVEYAVQAGGRFVVTIAKTAADTVDGLNTIFRKYNVAIRITADSDPRAVDYFFGAFTGATFGAGVGAGAAGAVWAALKAYKTSVGVDLFVPGLGQAIGIPAAIGAGVGAAISLSTTYYGLRIRFERLDLGSEPSGAPGPDNASAPDALAIDVAPSG
jgi:hypothetical protein